MKGRKPSLLLGIIFTAIIYLAVLPVTMTAGVTITVPDDYSTIQVAIDAASPGDKVYVRAGSYYENVTISKSLTLQGEDRDTTIIDGGKSGNVVYINADYVNINGFTIQNGGDWPHAGIFMDYSSGNTISGNTISNNRHFGIWMYYSSGNTISGNIVSNNGRYGIFLRYSGNNNILNNSISSNNGDAIVIWKTNSNTVANNLISNTTRGISVVSSHSNTISYNTICNNTYGLFMDSNCSSNTISYNTISDNGYGIFMIRSNSNTIHHNNFIDSYYSQAKCYSSTNNWEILTPNGYEGNYWSDYRGLDNGTGVGKFGEPRKTNDGIGDTNIPHLSFDWYPLMRPWSILQATIDIEPDTLNLKSKGKWITAYIELPEGFDVADIDVSTILLNDTVQAETKPASIGDYDDDGILDLMVKFDRADVSNILEEGDNVDIIITGELSDGPQFEGCDTIRVVSKGKK